ncbi:unnamed protein product, partial [Effrenium voratum]
MASSSCAYCLQEIDFDLFRRHIWGKICKDAHLSAPDVWREIQTFIKGHQLVVETESGFLSESEYQEHIHGKMNWAIGGCQGQAYKLFQHYEKHKKSLRGFDRMDLAVNLHQRLQRHGYQGPVLHHICVDEAQDLSQVEASLIMIVAKIPKRLVFVGDTCQTVSTETDFRFQDLRSCFWRNFNNTKPPELQSLLINYRSHDGIVQAANKIVELLEILFPMTIDRLDPAIGQNKGPRPERVDGHDLQHIFEELSRKSSNSLLGAHQMILVRTEEAKQQLLEVAGRAIGNIMTWEQLGTSMNEVEAKGLEFDDVIVVRFFEDFASDSQYLDWNALMRFNTGGPARFPGLACVELKRFYVAMTRAKRRLLFYDDSSSATAVVEYLGDTMGEMTEEMVRDLAGRAQQQQSVEEWDHRGHLFMESRRYRLALQCFERSGNAAGIQRCEAFLAREEAEAAESLELWRHAGQLLELLGENKEAAVCFFNAGDMSRAAALFVRARRYEDAAGAWVEAGDFNAAGMLFAREVQSASKAALCVVVMCDIHGERQQSADRTEEWLQQSGRKQGYEALCKLRRKDADEIEERAYQRGPASTQLVAEASRVAREDGSAVKGKVARCWRLVGVHWQAAELWRAGAEELRGGDRQKFLLEAGEDFVRAHQQDDAVACFDEAGYKGHVRAAGVLSADDADLSSLQRAVHQYDKALEHHRDATILERMAVCCQRMGGDSELRRAAGLFGEVGRWPAAAQAFAQAELWADAAKCEEKGDKKRAKEAAEFWVKAGETARAAERYDQRKDTKREAAAQYKLLGRWRAAALRLAEVEPKEALEICEQRDVRGWALARSYECLGSYAEASEEIMETLWADAPAAQDVYRELLREHQDKMSCCSEEKQKHKKVFERCKEVSSIFSALAPCHSNDEPEVFELFRQVSGNEFEDARKLRVGSDDKALIKTYGRMLEAATEKAFNLIKKERASKKKGDFVRKWHGCQHVEGAWDFLFQEGLFDELISRACALESGLLGDLKRRAAAVSSLRGWHQTAAQLHVEHSSASGIDDVLWRACLEEEQWLLQIPPEEVWDWVAGSHWEPTRQKSIAVRQSEVPQSDLSCGPLIAAKAFGRMGDCQLGQVEMGLKIGNDLLKMLNSFSSKTLSDPQIAGILWIEHEIPSLSLPWLFLKKDLDCRAGYVWIPSCLGCSQRPCQWQALGLQEVREEVLKDFVSGSLMRTLSTHLKTLSRLARSGFERLRLARLYRSLSQTRGDGEAKHCLFQVLQQLYDDELQEDFRWQHALRLAAGFTEEFRPYADMAWQRMKEDPPVERWGSIFRMLSLGYIPPNCENAQSLDIPDLEPRRWRHWQTMSESNRKCMVEARYLMRLGWLPELSQFWLQQDCGAFAAAALAIRLSKCWGENPLPARAAQLNEWTWEQQRRAERRPETDEPMWQLRFALGSRSLAAVQKLACQAVPELWDMDKRPTDLTDEDAGRLSGCQLLAESVKLPLKEAPHVEVLKAGCQRLAQTARILDESTKKNNYMYLLQKCHAAFCPAGLERWYLAQFFAGTAFTFDTRKDARGRTFQKFPDLWHLELEELEEEVADLLLSAFASLQKALLRCAEKQSADKDIQLCCWSYGISLHFPPKLAVPQADLRQLKQDAASQIYRRVRYGWNGHDLAAMADALVSHIKLSEKALLETLEPLLSSITRSFLLDSFRQCQKNLTQLTPSKLWSWWRTLELVDKCLGNHPAVAIPLLEVTRTVKGPDFAKLLGRFLGASKARKGQDAQGRFQTLAFALAQASPELMQCMRGPCEQSCQETGDYVMAAALNYARIRAKLEPLDLLAGDRKAEANLLLASQLLQAESAHPDLEKAAPEKFCLAGLQLAVALDFGKDGGLEFALDFGKDGGLEFAQQVAELVREQLELRMPTEPKEPKEPSKLDEYPQCKEVCSEPRKKWQRDHSEWQEEGRKWQKLHAEWREDHSQWQKDHAQWQPWRKLSDSLAWKSLACHAKRLTEELARDAGKVRENLIQPIREVGTTKKYGLTPQGVLASWREAQTPDIRRAGAKLVAETRLDKELSEGADVVLVSHGDALQILQTAFKARAFVEARLWSPLNVQSGHRMFPSLRASDRSLKHLDRAELRELRPAVYETARIFGWKPEIVVDIEQLKYLEVLEIWFFESDEASAKKAAAEDLGERDVFQLQKFFRLSPEMETWISDTEKAWSGGVDFSFQISPHEAELVASPGPLVVVGRSGSGKTLCCLERIWLTHRKWVYSSRQGDGAESELPRQVFVTLSPALAENVRSNFERRAVASGLPGAVPGVVEEDLPDSLGETPQESFPLFVTFAKLMRMLDASIGGTPFFPRLPCGKIDSNLVTFTTTGRFQTGGIARDHLQEIDFNIFRQHIMRTMKRTSLTAEVLWREIQTFIKGHRLVIETEHGYLSEVQYFTEIGKKMNWAMDGREEEAYALFRQYEIHKKRLGGFDRMDLAVDLLRRLGRHGYHGPRLDDTCVDEAQDLSQVEAVLIMQVVKSPENLIFVGDTCQTVSTETDFRFQDLISCFTEVLHKKPPKLKSLLINYRSHDGIVQAANKIVKLLEILYPQAIDRLDPAMGQNRGPQPERIGLEGLRRIFRELSRSSSRCLLGAHQMILVRTEEAKRQLREVADMEIGNVITMDQLGTLMNEVEAKGLEFDDVIVARFFQDSQYSEWSRLMRRAAAGRDKHHVFENQDGLACMELKRFYVAMTRAKKRLLFYDDSSSATAVIEHLGDTMGQMTEEAVQELAARAQQQQTSEQWDQRGCDFMRAQNFKQALQCFHLSGNVQGVQRCEAFLMRQEAEAKDDLGLWRQAGQLFQALGENREAADCFLKAGEMATAATLFLAVGRFKDAAGAWLEGGNFIQAGMLFASQLQSARKAAQCVVVMCDMCWKHPRSAELTTEWLKQSGRKQGYEALCELRRKDPDEIKEQEYKRGPASMELVAEATRVAQEGGPAIKGQVACCWRQVGLHKEAAELWRAAATESEELTASRDFFMKAGEAFVSFGQHDDAVACFENAGYRGHIRAAEELSGTGSLQRAVDQYEQ